MEAGPRYLEGTTVGSGRDIIGVRRDRIADIIGTGREIIARAKSDKLLPETITGATAALLVTIAGYGEPLSEGQWRELAGGVGGIMRDSTYADLAPLRTLITQEQFLNVARHHGYSPFIRRPADGRRVGELGVAVGAIVSAIRVGRGGGEAGGARLRGGGAAPAGGQCGERAGRGGRHAARPHAARARRAAREPAAPRLQRLREHAVGRGPVSPV